MATNILYIFSFLSSLIITWLWILYSKKAEIYDNPNHRSSHNIPTPRGGGIAIVITSILIGIIYVLLTFPDSKKGIYLLSILPFFIIVSLPLIIVSIVGFVDDKDGMSGRLKLSLTLVACLFLFIFMPKIIEIRFFVDIISLPSIYFMPIFLAGFIWIINLTNFMDGINGIATLQAIFILFSFVILGVSANESVNHLALICLFSCLGFLVFNFPKAKVFLGDIGSLFLGMLFVYLFLGFITLTPNGLFVFLILFSMFWLDATLTLFRRIFSGYSIFQAHNSHAYQHLANKRLNSHTKASLFVLIINIFWLLPAGYICLNNDYPFVIFIIAILPVLAYCNYLKSGKSFD